MSDGYPGEDTEPIQTRGVVVPKKEEKTSRKTRLSICCHEYILSVWGESLLLKTWNPLKVDRGSIMQKIIARIRNLDFIQRSKKSYRI